MNKILLSLLFFAANTQLLGDETTTNYVSPIAKEIQFGLDNLLTKPTRSSNAKYYYTFTDQNVVFSNQIEFKKINITAENNNIALYMVQDEQTGQDVNFIGLPSGTPSFNLYPKKNHGIYIEVLTDTEFIRVPHHNVRVTKKAISDSEDGFVEWDILNNKRVLFAPIGYKSTSIELPEDATTHIIEEGSYVDNDLTLNGICLVNGAIYVVADTQDVTVHLNKETWLMNANDTDTCALILLANVDRKITIKVDEKMEWRSHLNAPFYVVQAGPGKVEVKIVANDND